MKHLKPNTMKRKTFLPLALAALLALGLASSCQNAGTDPDQADSLATAAANAADSAALAPALPDSAAKVEDVRVANEYVAAYICPMHCPGSGSDKPGTCPSCSMELIQNPNAKAE